MVGMKITKKEVNALKREVANATGRNIKDIETIESFAKDFISFGYYESNYDRVTNNLTVDIIKR